MMRTRMLVGALFVLALLTAGTFATNGTNVGPAKRWATVSFDRPTRLGSQLLIGSYVIVHDDEQMAQGKPCTTLYRFDPTRGPQEEVAKFMCVPALRGVAARTTLLIHRPLDVGTATLEGYQFAGDTEEHRVPKDVQ